VDFDPVRAKMEGRPPTGMSAEVAALFPDGFEESPLGKVPRGWVVVQLDDLLLLQRGFDLAKPKRRPGPYPVFAAGGINGYHAEYMVKGPGVTTGRSGVLGKVYLIQEDFWPLNTSLWVKEFRHSTPIFSYFLLRMFKLDRYNAGSAVATLNRNHIHNLPAIKPPRQLIERFEALAQPLFYRQKINQEESKTLGEIKDTLLPKLLSGQLRIQDAEKFVEQVA
jgi:type I restriction enzyme S subunit